MKSKRNDKKEAVPQGKRGEETGGSYAWGYFTSLLSQSETKPTKEKRKRTDRQKKQQKKKGRTKQ